MIFKRISPEVIGVVAVSVLIVFVVVTCFAGIIENERNRIDSGVIVNKRFDSGGIYYSNDKSGASYRNYPPSYYFTIEGRKNGETVRYTFEVSETEYNQYKIGDNYSR